MNDTPKTQVEHLVVPGSHVAVTGAAGFLGQHITEALLAAGYRVSILARSADKTAPFRGRVERTVIGDINDGEAIAKLVENADAVIHLVSNFRKASGPPASYYATNLEGTRTTLDAARAAGVKRFLHCSTIGVHGHVETTPADESSLYNPGDLYQQTKVQAEQLCLERARESTNMEIVILRPCSQYGPGDLRMLKMFRMLEKRTFLMLGPCRQNFHGVYIDDVVDGFLRALTTPGIHGEAFILGGREYLPLRDYIAAAARAVGAPMPWLRLPYAPFYAASVVCEAVCVPFGVEPPLHRRRLRFYENNRAFSTRKAQERLGYQPAVSLELGLQRTVSWYRENGHLALASGKTRALTTEANSRPRRTP